MLGLDTLASIPISGFASTSVDPIVYSFLSSSQKQSVYLVFECTVHKFDPSIANTLYPAPMSSLPFGDLGTDNTLDPVTLQFSDIPLVIRTSLSGAATNILIEGRLVSPFNYETSIPTPSGTSSIGNVDLGVIELINADRELDYLLDSNLDGATFTLKLGGSYLDSSGALRELAYDELLVVYQGIIDNVSSNSGSLNLVVKNLFSLLENQPLQSNFYQGTGGLDGSSNIEGNPKPMAFGRLNGIPPILVDETRLIYQVHDGSIEQVIAVKDNGIALTSAGSVSDIEAWTQIPGQYAYDLTKGYIRLGAKPAGFITCDIKGDNYLEYKEDTIGIVKKILRFSSLLESQIDYVSLASTSISGICGYYNNGNELNINQALNDLMLAGDGWIGFNNRGQLSFGKYLLPDESTSVARTYETFEIYSIDVENTANPIWKAILNYDKIWGAQTEETLGAALDIDVKKRLSKEFRNITKVNYNTKTYYRNSEVLSKDTYFVDLADAEAQAVELLKRGIVKRRIYSINVDDTVLSRKVGEIIDFKLLEQFGIGTAPKTKRLMIIGVTENKRANELTIRAWG